MYWLGIQTTARRVLPIDRYHSPRGSNWVANAQGPSLQPTAASAIRLGKFGTFFNTKLLTKEAQAYVDILGYFGKHLFLSIAAVDTSWVMPVNFLATFYSYIWSHSEQPTYNLV